MEIQKYTMKRFGFEYYLYLGDTDAVNTITRVMSPDLMFLNNNIAAWLEDNIPNGYHFSNGGFLAFRELAEASAFKLYWL